MFRLWLAFGMLALCVAQLPQPARPIRATLATPTKATTRGPRPTTTATVKPKPKPKPASYWITYSKTIRPGQFHVFQVQILKGTSPVEISIVFKDRSQKIVFDIGPYEILPGKPESIKVKIPSDIKKPSEENYWDRNYAVEITGQGSELRFKERSYATYAEKSFSIFVQTDKAMYKPSQKVQFRTLAMDPDMKVKRDVKQDIIVMDSKGNQILHLKDVMAEKDHAGVVQESFQLASSVPLGKWKIIVTIENTKEEKQFEVSDYVLPRFEVEVEAEPYGLEDDLVYEFTVKAKYTFGKPLTEGKVDVAIALRHWDKSVKPLMKHGNLNSQGEMKVQVTIKELGMFAKKYRYYYGSLAYKTFEITVNVTEANTERVQSGSHDVVFYSTPIKLTFLGITPSSFKSGLDFTAYLEVTKQDGTLFTAAEAKKINVLFNVTYTAPKPPVTIPKKPPTENSTSSSSVNGTTMPVPIREIMDDYVPNYWYPRTITKVLKLEKDRFVLPENSWIVISFRIPDDARNIQIKAITDSLYEEANGYFSASKSYSPSDSFLQLNVINKKAKVGDLVKVQAKATEEMHLLNYQVFSKGLLLIGDEVSSLTGPVNVLEFSFRATEAMSPSMSIVAFYLRSDGEIVVAALSLSVDGLFQNAVSIEFSKEQVQPGEKVDVIVKGHEESAAFMLIVDKSVKLLKSGNDITQDMVRENLASYDYGNYGFWRYMSFCGWPSYFGGEDASSIFRSAGLIVLTDGLVYNRYEDSNHRQNGFPVAGATTVPDMENELAASKPDGSANKVKETRERTRKRFPENWLWQISTIVPNHGPMVQDAVAMEDAGGEILPAKRVRKLFPESWLWDAKIINMNGLMDRGLRQGSAFNTAPQAARKDEDSTTTIRKKFPETWLWDIAITGSGGKVVVPLTAPDTITTWVATVFSSNPEYGLSVAEAPAEVVTFRHLFVSLNLPSSIIRFEQFCFQASVYSYYPEDLFILLTLDHSDDFSNLWAKNKDGNVTLEKEKLYYSHFMPIQNNEIQTVTYCFTPEKIGSIPIRVSVMTDVAGLSDAVERKLPVKPEGVPRSTTKPYLVEPLNGQWEKSVDVVFPKDKVMGSERISVNIAGNLLGTIFNNLDDIVKKPYGCGEQNMINFSPLMSLLDFFFTTNTITNEIRKKAVNYMLIGYQKEILYEHGKTGSFSTFGNTASTKKNASMWLTAFVTKCFAQAELLDIRRKNVLAIDTNIIYRSANWMIDQQDTDGSFVENGLVFNKQLQGGSGSKGVSLTAYTVIAMHYATQVFENSTKHLISRQMASSFGKAVKYLEQSISSLTDPYDACITAYALNLVDSLFKDDAFAKMKLMSVTGFGYTYWKRPAQDSNRVRYWWSRNSDAINIEMTSYALLTYSLRGLGTTEGLPIIRWLSDQKGQNGGFISTQDTVIGIEALTSVAKDLYGAEFVPMVVTVKSVDGTGMSKSTDFEITRNNEMLLQRKDIPYETGSKIILSAKTADGVDTTKSTVLLDVVFNYNVDSETSANYYDMDYEVMTYEGGFDLSIKVWTLDGTKASMTMVEVEIPAGFFPSMDKIRKMNSEISSSDFKDGYLNVYLNTDVVTGEGIKLHLVMDHDGGVLLESKSKSIRVYNYYEDEQEVTKKYNLNKEPFCVKMPKLDVCQLA